MTGCQVGGGPFDLQGGAGPSAARRKIAEEGQEPAAARELRVEKIGRSLHGGDDTWGQVLRALGDDSKVVLSVVVGTGEPFKIPLVNQCAVLFVVVGRLDRARKLVGEAEFVSGERVPVMRTRKKAIPSSSIDGDLGQSIGARQPTGRMVLVQGKHGLVENGSGTAHSGDPAHGAVIKVPYPDSNREIVRKSDAPVVSEEVPVLTAALKGRRRGELGPKAAERAALSLRMSEIR